MTVTLRHRPPPTTHLPRRVHAAVGKGVGRPRVKVSVSVLALTYDSAPVTHPRNFFPVAIVVAKQITILWNRFRLARAINLLVETIFVADVL